MTCLTNHHLNWERVIGVIGNFPISNPREACKIAEKYIGMEETECQCIISTHGGNSKYVKRYETGIDKKQVSYILRILCYVPRKRPYAS